MGLNKDGRPTLIINLHYQKGYDAIKLTRKFPAKNWKKMVLNFVNRIKETGNFLHRK